MDPALDTTSWPAPRLPLCLTLILVGLACLGADGRIGAPVAPALEDWQRQAGPPASAFIAAPSPDTTGRCDDTWGATDARWARYCLGRERAGLVAELGTLGLDVAYPAIWDIAELRLVRDAVRRLQAVAGWADGDLRRNLGSRLWLARVRAAGFARDGCPTDDLARRELAAHWGVTTDGRGGWVAFSDWAVRSPEWPPAAVAFQAIVIHELAEYWDHATGGALSAGLASEIGGQTDAQGQYHSAREPGCAAGWRAASGPLDDWAESVAATVYPEAREPAFRGSAREAYVLAQLARYRRGN